MSYIHRFSIFAVYDLRVRTMYDVMMRICRSSMWARHIFHFTAHEMVHATPFGHFGLAQDKQNRSTTHTRSERTKHKQNKVKFQSVTVKKMTQKLKQSKAYFTINDVSEIVTEITKNKCAKKWVIHCY